MRKRDPFSQFLDELIDEVSDVVFDAVTDAISPLLPHREFKRQKRATTGREKGGAQPSSGGPRKRPTAAGGGGKGRKRKLEPTYYEVMGVPSWLSSLDLLAVYRSLALKWHPDKHTAPIAKLRAEERMKKINEAYTVLKDPLKREQYDNRLRMEGRL
jgi:DnaJ domain